MILDLSVLASTATQVLAESSSSDDSGSIAFLFLLAGPLFYGLIYLKYRNTDKRHKHEAETEASLHNLQEDDRYHRALKGVSNSKMEGANNHEVRGARRKFF